MDRGETQRGRRLVMPPPPTGQASSRPAEVALPAARLPEEPLPAIHVALAHGSGLRGRHGKQPRAGSDHRLAGMLLGGLALAAIGLGLVVAGRRGLFAGPKGSEVAPRPGDTAREREGGDPVEPADQSPEPARAAPRPLSVASSVGPAEPPSKSEMLPAQEQNRVMPAGSADDEPARESTAAAFAVTTALTAAYAAMQSDEADAVEAAMAAADAAAGQAAAAVVRQRVERWQTLWRERLRYREQVPSAIAAVGPGQRYELNGQPLEVLAVDQGQLTVRFREKRERTYPLDRLPAGVERAVMREWFQRLPEGGLAVGAEAFTRAVPQLEEARQAWQAAEATDAQRLLMLLEDPVALPPVQESSGTAGPRP
jgi:hypothetical protein